MTMGNPNAPGRLEILEQEMAKIKEFVMGTGRDELVTTVGEIAKKQDKTEQILAILMEGQAKNSPLQRLVKKISFLLMGLAIHIRRTLLCAFFAPCAFCTLS